MTKLFLDIRGETKKAFERDYENRYDFLRPKAADLIDK